MGESTAALVSSSASPTKTASSKRPSLGLRAPSAHLVTGPESSRHESGIHWRRKRRRVRPTPPPWEQPQLAELALEFFLSSSSSRKKAREGAVGARAPPTLLFFFACGRKQRRIPPLFLTPLDGSPSSLFFRCVAPASSHAWPARPRRFSARRAAVAVAGEEEEEERREPILPLDLMGLSFFSFLSTHSLTLSSSSPSKILTLPI